MSEQMPTPAASLRQVVVFELDQEEYAVAIEQVKEVINVPKITFVPNGQSFVLGVMNLRGQIVPIIDLEKLFGLPHSDSVPTQQHVVISQDSTQALFGVQVDQVREVLRVPEASVKPTPKIVNARISAEYLDGVIILEEEKKSSSSSRIILQLNLQKIMTEKILNQIKQEGNNPAL